MQRVSDYGFTLIELVIVIVILGIVAAIAIPRMGNLTDSSKASVTQSELTMLKRAIVGNPKVVSGGQFIDVGFEGNTGFPPQALADLTIKPDSVAVYNKFTRLGWNGPYVDSAGGDYLKDSWGSNYILNASARTITSVGGPDTIIAYF